MSADDDLRHLGVDWLAGVFASMLWALTIHYKIVEAANSKRPGEEPIGMFNNPFRGITDYRVWSLYRAYFPEGKLLRKYWSITVCGWIWFALALTFLYQTLNHARR